MSARFPFVCVESSSHTTRARSVGAAYGEMTIMSGSALSPAGVGAGALQRASFLLRAVIAAYYCTISCIKPSHNYVPGKGNCCSILSVDDT